ncbi:MAG: FG-GAP-like repeat-containing protein [Nitrospira sp.]|nr:FG-GAP-like repeat-containing protein [Nitrospira sp.]
MIGFVGRVFTPWTVCGAVVLVAAGSVPAQNLVFTPVLSAPVGAHPEGLTVGDFNEDGHLDIATANSDSDDVSVLLGNGNGTFRSSYSFGVGRSPMFLTTGDLNLDGTADLAVAETGAGRVLILFGKGNGFFEEPVPYPSGKGPTFLALGDVDGDDDLDVVVVNSGRFGHYPPFSWSVLSNNGQGDFTLTHRVEEQDRNGLFPTGASLADLDDDGLPEVTLTWSQPSWRTPNGYVSVFRNRGQGTFAYWKTIRAGFTLSAVTQTDVDADGDLDLMVASVFTDSIKLLLQLRPGQYTKPANMEVGFSPVGLGYKDLDGDGHRDLVSTNRASDSTSILLGRGDGSFQPAGHYAVGKVPTAMGIEDFDHDGLPDIVTANSGSDDVSILLNGKAVIPSISLSADTIRFAADVDAPARRTLQLTISNVGLGPLSIDDIALEGSRAFSVDRESCTGATLTTGELCVLPVHFQSTAPGVHQALLRIFDNAPGGPRIVTLSGTGDMPCPPP